MGSDDAFHGDRKAMEQRLLRMAREYEKQEEEKQITQATYIGHPLMSEEEVQAILNEQERKKTEEENQRRAADRARAVTEKEERRVVVDVHAHPMNTVDAQPLSFRVSAADRVAARKELLEQFITSARTLLIINRVQNRLAKAKATLKGEKIAHHHHFDVVPTLSLISLPVMPNSSAMPTLPHDPDVAAEAAQAIKVDTFEPIDMKVPLHFRQMGYKPFPLPEHPFVSADAPCDVQLFPFGDNEPTDKEQQPLPQSLVVDPVPSAPISMTHEWPTQDFTFAQYVRTDLFPYDVKQPEDSLGFSTPFFAYDYGMECIPPTTVWKTLSNAVLHAPLPQPLMKARSEDALSDTDDEDATDVVLDVRPPRSLKDVAAVFGGLGDSFLVTGRESEDPADLIPLKPIHTFDLETLNKLRTGDVEKIYDTLESCLPAHLRKKF